MTTITRSIENFSVSEISVSILLGSAALLILGVQPILLGELVSSGHVDLDGVGLIAMAEIISIGIGAAIAPASFSGDRFRFIAAVAMLVLAGANMASAYSAGLRDLLVARMVAGLSSGVLVWITSSLIVRVPNPPRVAAVFLTVQTLAQALLAVLLAMYILPGGGWSWGFLSLACLVLLPGLLLNKLPNQMRPLAADGSARPTLTLGVALASLIVIFQMAAVGSLWTFIEPIGVAAGLEAQSVQLVVSLTLIMQAIGCAVAATVSPRLDARAILVLGGVVQCSVAFFVGNYLTSSMPPFVLACSVFGFTWLFTMPFHIQLALRFDPSGRLAVIGPAFQLLGSALGPLVASLLVTANDAKPPAFASVGFALISIVLLLVLALIRSPKSKVYSDQRV